MKHIVDLILDFLRPSLIKLFFLVEWVLLVLNTLVYGELSIQDAFVGSILPMAFFYLLASTLSALSRHRQQIARGGRLHLLALALVCLDQMVKAIISMSIPYQGTLPILQGLFHLTNERNLHASWLLETLDLRLNTSIILGFVILPFLLATLVSYGYYISRHRKCVWVDAAYLGLFAGLLSAACDLTLRGYIIDYLQIPGIVIADIKDVLITIAMASFFAEAYTNPNISLLRWRGWREEIHALWQLIKGVLNYTQQEITRLRVALVNGWNERFRS